MGQAAREARRVASRAEAREARMAAPTAAEARAEKVAAALAGPGGHFTQTHENDLARVVIVCAPGIPKMMGALHPAGSLYERPVNLETAKAEHRGLRAALRRF